MKSFKIAQDPTFKADVVIPRVNGQTITVPFVFKYFGRKDLAAMFVEWQGRAKADQEALEALGEAASLIDGAEAQTKHQIGQVLDIVSSWAFTDPLNEDSVRALVDSTAGVGEAIVEAYQKAYLPARLGN
jgi:hypothetical protein